jgi:DNA gyrase subunit B
MYVGDTKDGTGLHRMVREVASNAMNEALAGYGERIDIILNSDGSCTVRDEGRGIPTDPFQGTSVAQVIMTRLSAAGKFEQSHRPSCTVEQVGMAVVNALSERLELRIWRDGRAHFMEFYEGNPQAPLRVTGGAISEDGVSLRGTEISFLPDARFFDSIRFDFAVIEDMLRAFALLGSRCSIVLTDRRGIETKQVVITSS